MKKIIATFLLSTFAFMGINTAAFAYEQGANAKQVRTEHLMVPKKVKKKSPTDVVVSTNVLTSVIEYNVIEVTFAENFSTKDYKVGDEVGFLLNNGLTTNEGTEILPQGSQIVASVSEIVKPKSFNRSGKVLLLFHSVVLPDGKVLPLNAKVFQKKEMLSRGKLNALGKGMGSTLAGVGIGIGAGCGIGVAAGAVIVGGFAIGLPVGFAIGAIAGLVTPGLHYKAKAGDKLLIQLTDDLDVYK